MKNFFFLFLFFWGFSSQAQIGGSIFNPLPSPDSPPKVDSVHQERDERISPSKLPTPPTTIERDESPTSFPENVDHQNSDMPSVSSLARVHSAANLPLHSPIYRSLDRMEIKRGKFSFGFHSSQKPYSRSEVGTAIPLSQKFDPYSTQYITADNFEFIPLESKRNFLKHFYQHPGQLYHTYSNGSFTLGVNPVLHFSYGREIDVDEHKFANTRGIELRGVVDKRISFYTRITENQVNYMEYVHARIDSSAGVVPGEGRSKRFKGNRNVADFLTARGYFNIQASEHIDVQFGQDKNFIGDGMRSLILSDHAKDMLFLKLKTNVWKISYQNLWSEMANFKPKNRRDGLIEKKYMANHHLSINLTDNLNVGLFETVIYGRGDSVTQRVFEWHYMNPIIFFRSVEFGLGSADNVLLGFDWKWNFLNQFQFYGQGVLDEFKKDDLFGRTGWWGNKHAYQLGLKWIEPLSAKNLDLQIELNRVRPYTYGFRNNLGSFSHYSTELAHPLGANFTEVIGRASYQPHSKVSIDLRAMFAKKGVDTSGTNFGGDIFQSSSTREMDFDNEIGQGFSQDLFMLDFLASYMIFHNCFLDFRMITRSSDSDVRELHGEANYFSLGLRMNLNPEHRMY